MAAKRNRFAAIFLQYKFPISLNINHLMIIKKYYQNNFVERSFQVRRISRIMQTFSHVLSIHSQSLCICWILEWYIHSNLPIMSNKNIISTFQGITNVFGICFQIIWKYIQNEV